PVLLLFYSLFYLLTPPAPPSSTLFPYTTLFRSGHDGGAGDGRNGRARPSDHVARGGEDGVDQQRDHRGVQPVLHRHAADGGIAKDRKSTRLNSSHVKISYAVFCLKKKSKQKTTR